MTETDRLKEIDAVRTSLLGPLATLIAATAVLAGAVVAYLNFRGTLELNRRGQVTERFSKAIDQLGERGEGEFEKLDIRLGAIYALEQIARDSPELHWPIVEILTAFVREHTKADAGAKPGSDEPDQEPAASYKVAADIQAVLTVVSRRNPNYDRGMVDLSGADLRGADLRQTNFESAYLQGVDLRGENLQSANFQWVYLVEANLQDARLFEVQLQSSDLARANLRGAKLSYAQLRGTHLRKANLERADLTGTNPHLADLIGANLRGADFSAAQLDGAFLRDTDLSEVLGLGQKQLDSARCNSETKPPSGLTAHVEQ